jgi:hypothetical protein
LFDQVLRCQFGSTRGSGCGITAVDARTDGAYQLRCLILILSMDELFCRKAS